MDITSDIKKEMLNNKISELIKKYGNEIKLDLYEILILCDNASYKQNLNKTESRLIPIANWNKYHDYPTVNALRQRIKRNSNNICRFVHNDGGRIVIDEQAYLASIRLNAS